MLPSRYVFVRRRGSSSLSCIRSQSTLSRTRYDLSSPPNAYIRCSAKEALEGIPSDDLVLHPSFLDEDEQRVLLAASLMKLDSMAGRDERKRKRNWIKNSPNATQGSMQGKYADGHDWLKVGVGEEYS